jgi:carboxypeptidase PM20D1
MIPGRMQILAQRQFTRVESNSVLQPSSMIEHLSSAIQCRTIAADDPSESNDVHFLRLHNLLIDAYPRLHQNLTRQTVNGLSLLYEWRGTDPSLEPVLLLAHQDVVPAESEHAWLHPPFAGQVSDGAVWGRGAIDAKGGLIAICQAIEHLLADGFKPTRTVFLAFGHDEEVGGLQGASAISEILAERGIRPLFISDEGGAILHGVIPGVRHPVAAVGIAEKGYLTLELKVVAGGGHASMPPAQTAIGILSDAIQRIEASPFPAKLAGATREMIKCLGTRMPFPARMAIAMLPLTAPIIRHRLEKTLSGAAALRTTTAVTMIESGVKDNILPNQATATLNCRILPGENSQSVIARIAQVINDSRVGLAIAGRFHSEPPPVADTHSVGYALIKRAIGEIAPDAVVAPCLVLGGTDSRHYTRLTSAVYRFGAMRINPEDLTTIHGTNEKLTFENCELLERFYVRLLSNSASN